MTKKNKVNNTNQHASISILFHSIPLHHNYCIQYFFLLLIVCFSKQKSNSKSNMTQNNPSSKQKTCQKQKMTKKNVRKQNKQTNQTTLVSFYLFINTHKCFKTSFKNIKNHIIYSSVSFELFAGGGVPCVAAVEIALVSAPI